MVHCHPSHMELLTTHSVRQYYEQNTRLFLSLGSTRGSQAIHRALWARGTRSLDEALNYSNELLLAEAARLDPGAGAFWLADLGCGVGGSLRYLLQRLGPETRGVGLTISPTQARLARTGSPGFPGCLFLEADFQAPPLASRFGFAWAVEAAAHAPDPAAFYHGAASLLQPGGKLAIIDDWLAEPQPPEGAAWVAAYRRGWRMPGLLSARKACALADAAGLRLVQQVDLTPMLRLRTLPNPAARVLLHAASRVTRGRTVADGLLGSLALQHCLKDRLIRYQFLLFEKG